ncbi:hypothetical protein FE840_014480 [Peteryoungia desertarenae]|uniref:DUF3971 domain-containing protein n=1 Tax=Peteryoungia desertarenae TaxID=1813451 RepID=A0ABX6QQ53_9HYPH|nr:DUF3971 domain-containing protein [Peteryoungia desertarenae]QLF70648.1 hypothetical protein FE840_014480 [Peteryoungia desertarenae]
MAEIRGEKLRFRKRDIVPLEALPSAQVDDPLIVHCPPRRSVPRRFFRFFVGFLGLWLVAFAGLYAVVESGALDKALAERAAVALNSSVGDGLRADIGSTAIRFSSLFDISVEARDVQLVNDDSNDLVAVTKSVRLVLEPLALLGGNFSVREIVADGVALDAALLPEREPLNLTGFRIDALPALLTEAFDSLDDMKDFIGQRGLDRMRIGGLEIAAKSVSGRPLTIGVEDLAMERGVDGSLSIFGAVSINGQQTDLTILSTTVGDETRSLTMRIADLRVTPFLLRRDSQGNPRQGLDGQAEILVTAKKGVAGQEPLLSFQIRSEDAQFYSDGHSSELTRADLRLSYDYSKNTLELRDSVAEFGPMVMPLSGGFIDLDRLPEGAGKGPGFGIDLLVTGGLASVPAAGEQPFLFDLKAFGRYLADEKQLDLDQLAVATPHGTMEGFLGMRFGGTGPEVRFEAAIEHMKTVAIKQLWPFWIADKPRDWVLENVFGGTVKNANISVIIPQNRLSIEPRPLQLDEDELKISFEIEDARMNVAGDIPPLRDMNARFDMVGAQLAVAIQSAASYFPSGRVVNVEAGAFSIDDVYQKPLMADISLAMAGNADAVAELASFRPIAALERTEFSVADFTGQVRGNAQLRVGLIQSQNPPDTVWNASLMLDDVDVAKPFDGRKVEDFAGKLALDAEAMRIEGAAKVDGIDMDIVLVEPVHDKSATKPERVVSMALDNRERRKLVPGLDDLIDGEIGVRLTRRNPERQSVEVDLRRANLNLPWIGWSKGQGIAAKAKFDVVTRGDENQIDRFVLDGDGFYGEGAFVVGPDGLKSANFGKIQLSPGDNLALTVRENKGAYSISVSGAQVDARALIKELKRPASEDATKADRISVRVEAQIDRVVGFGDETLSGVSLLYSATGGKPTSLDFSGVTRSSQAVVAKLRPVDGLNQVSVTSSDAGAVSRFADLYARVLGGLLNLKLNQTQTGSWYGNIDLRNFQINNEERLQSIVSTPTGQDGRSLNSAVRRDIDVSSARFQRGFARLLFSEGTLSVENGIVRGEQIGASFQGVVRDASGRIDLTGTFMPAYGLNRLFGELPIIGAILGNGSDRGLLGITFKLTGPTERPNLIINPLSIIAPGVFRQIFEFR